MGEEETNLRDIYWLELVEIGTCKYYSISASTCLFFIFYGEYNIAEDAISCIKVIV